MININKINKNLIDAQYAVRGKIVIRAQELEEQGKKIIYCNIGNPQALKQKPLTYIRQALSLLEYPELLNNENVNKIFPSDIIERVKFILKKHPHGTGAYSQSAGVPFVRQTIADFISERDGIPADKEHIILTDGASKGVQAAITALLNKPEDGIMIPIPQYPLYSATITLMGGRQIGYFLDEENSWQLNQEILEGSIKKAKKEGTNPVAIAVINPGNPTGAILSRDNILMIIRFAQKNQLSILADEVYQENIYNKDIKFYSFAKVMFEEKINDVTLFSFHSVSKGYLGECGHRGGYFEIRNVPGDVMAQFIKLQSINLCSNLTGQFVTYLMVAPPEPGDESYELYVKERDGILNDLKEKARILGEGLSKIEGIYTEIPCGAMYAFVRFELPPEKGVEIGLMTPDEKIIYESKRDSGYCMALLEETGICVVPGSGFGQLPGTLHFRTTFLPPKDEIESLVEKMRVFHINYVKKIQEGKYSR